MPNTLSKVLHSWKSFTSHQIGKTLRRAGELWQDESFDHIVRDEQHLARFSRYIAENPNKARLASGIFRLGGGLATREHASGSGAGVSPATGASRPRTIGVPAPDTGETPGPTGGTPAPLLHDLGLVALRNGEVAVITLAAGAGSRWTQGAGVVKALHPFCKLAGRHRTFIEAHLAKSRRLSRLTGTALPHVFTTSYLTHGPTEEFLARENHYGYDAPLFLSPGKAIGLRMVPTVRDLRFLWEEMPQQILDEQ
jgi:hypothetical protein